MAKNVKIITRLAEKGWTARELSARSGVSYPTVSRLLNKRHMPTAATAAAIAAQLDRKVSELFAEIHVPGEQHKKATA